MATLKDIAEYVGVQKSTVSRILSPNSGTYKFSEQTRKKVIAAAQKLGYQPNSAAQALATQRTGHLGFILTDSVEWGWENPHFAQYLCGVEQACRQFGYALNIFLYNSATIDKFIFPKGINQNSVDGVILCGHTQEETVRILSKAGLPVICLGKYTVAQAQFSGNNNCVTVGKDAVSGYYDLICHCANYGHQRILFCGGGHKTSIGDIDELRARLKKSSVTSDIQLDMFIASNKTCDPAAAVELFQYWQNTPKRDQASVIISSDQTIFSLLRELQSKGFSCPDDLSLVCGSDTSLCQLSYPALSAVRYDIPALTSKAVSLLVDHLDNDLPISQSKQEYLFPGELMLRESIGTFKG